MARLYLVRHGRAAACWGGDLDPRYDEVGVRRAGDSVVGGQVQGGGGRCQRQSMGREVDLRPARLTRRGGARRIYAPLEAVVDGERRFTYGELSARAHRLAWLLRDGFGCRPG